MFRPINSPVKYFPELAGMPHNIQEEIAEQARYQTYMKKGGRKKFVRPYIIVGLFGVAATVVISTLLSWLFAISPVYFIWIGVSFTMVYAIHLQQKNLLQHMRPKVQELAKRYSSIEK